MRRVVIAVALLLTPPLAVTSVIACPACGAALTAPDVAGAQPVLDGDASWPAALPPTPSAAVDWDAAPTPTVPE